MNFTLPLINEWIQAKRCPILWTKFIFKTICFGLRNCNVNAKDKKDVYLSYIATRCLFVCLSSISPGTAGPIWLNFFCQLRLGHEMVLGQKNSGSGIRFFRKKNRSSRQFYLYTLNIFWQKSLNLLLKNAGTIKFIFYKFSSISLSFDVEEQSQFQKPLEASGEAASIYRVPHKNFVIRIFKL